MKLEQSYGAVLFKGKEVLIEYMTLGPISIPKGHVEGKETPVQTAKREIKEEVNLVADIDTNYEYQTGYCPKEGVYKKVSFFLGLYKSGEIKFQLSEVESAKFMSVGEALKILTYESDREAVKGAFEYLEKHYHVWEIMFI